MTVVIVDDEINAIRSIELSLKEYCPEIKVLGSATSAAKGIQEIDEHQPDLVFLDIQMPHMSGIELLETYETRNFEVIFVTAYNQYAIKALQLSAADYLLKPLNPVELIKAVDRIKTRLSKSLTVDGQKFDKLRIAMSGKIAFPSRDGTEYVKMIDIIRIEAYGAYSNIFTIDGKKKIVSKNLSELQSILLNGNFFRSHKSYLINLSFVKKYLPKKDGGIIEMSDGSIIKVSRKQKPELTLILRSNFKKY